MSGFFCVCLDQIRKLDLVGIKFHTRVLHIELLDFLDTREFVVHEHFKVDVAELIKIHLVSVIPDGHDKRSILIKKADLLR